MTFLTRIGIEKSRLSILVMLLAIAIGASSYLNLPKREDPEIIIRTAIVTAANPGLRLEQLEELVAMELVAISVPCLDLKPEKLAELPVSFEDGRHDAHDKEPEVTSYL